MERLPDRVIGDGVLLRRWLVSDAEQLDQAIAQSAEHLRPWMSWMADEPQALDARRELIRSWEHSWYAGGEVLLGIFVDGHVAGGTGLHRRRGPDTLEIGYWTHAAYLRQGIATRAVRALTHAALALHAIDHIEIRHDTANVASRRVPERLCYELVGQAPNDLRLGLAETGVDCVWRATRGNWSPSDG
jgi:RimJ/RimL family protein N-acetyltransferase